MLESLGGWIRTDSDTHNWFVVDFVLALWEFEILVIALKQGPFLLSLGILCGGRRVCIGNY